MRNEVPTRLANAVVMLSGAKHLWLLLDSEKDQRFFASLRMTMLRHKSTEARRVYSTRFASISMLIATV